MTKNMICCILDKIRKAKMQGKVLCRKENDMDIFSIITLGGGLAFFLYGMHTLSAGLEKIAGGKLERMLRKMTDKPFKSLLLGAGITIAIQSSSAMTVMLVGLVNSGIMEVRQTIGAIMGSNIGTTLTAWILSLAGIEGDNILIRLLKPSSFSPIIALVGMLMIMTSKNNRKKDVGTIMVGFAILMFGMELMQEAMSPLAEMPEFAQILTVFQNPLLGVVVGAAFTAIIQSSAASVAILQALSLTGNISYGMAIPIIMGQNIGTCITALISSIGGSKEAKKVAVIHISYNVIGTVLCLILFYGLDALVHFGFTDAAIDGLGIAACHSIFNVSTTVMLFPFGKYLEKLANLLVRRETPKDTAENDVFLDERVLRSPAFALQECKNLSLEMAEMSRRSIFEAMSLLWEYDEEKAAHVRELEDKVDVYEDRLGNYLVKLSGRELSDRDSKEVSKILHGISDMERISDHAVNIVDTAEEIRDKQLVFSPEADKELHTLTAALTEILTISTEAFINSDVELARKVEPIEQVIDDLTDEIKDRHINRLQRGTCTISLGFVLNDLLTNFERISDHCSNIGVCVIQLQQEMLESHDYLRSMKASGQEAFQNMYQQYEEKYKL